jgi:hypothetical protein
MYLKIILLSIFIFIFGCSDKVNKNNINLIQYLPNGNVGTTYISFFTHTGNNQVVEKKTITKKTKQCITFNVQLIKNNHIESESIRKMCANNNKLYSDTNYTNEPLVDLSKKRWIGYKMYIDAKETKMTCQFESIGTMIFDKKQHNTFEIKCKAKNMAVTFLYADMLGLVKVEQAVDNYGIVGGIKLKSVEIK